MGINSVVMAANDSFRAKASSRRELQSLDEREAAPPLNYEQHMRAKELADYGNHAWIPANQDKSRKEAAERLQNDPADCRDPILLKSPYTEDITGPWSTPKFAFEEEAEHAASGHSKSVLDQEDTVDHLGNIIKAKKGSLESNVNMWRIEQLKEMSSEERLCLKFHTSEQPTAEQVAKAAHPGYRSPVKETYDNLQKEHPAQYGHGSQLLRSNMRENLDTEEKVKEKWDMVDSKQVVDSIADEHASAAYLKRQPRNGDQSWSTSSVTSRWSRHSGATNPNAAGGAAASDELYNQVSYYVDDDGRRIALNARRVVEAKALQLGIPVPLDMWGVGRGEYKDLRFPSQNLPDGCDGPRSRGTSKYLETPDHCPGNVGSSGNAASENKDHWRTEGNRHTPEVIYKYDRGQRVMPSRHTKRAAPIRCVNMDHRAPGGGDIRASMAMVNKFSL